MQTYLLDWFRSFWWLFWEAEGPFTRSDMLSVSAGMIFGVLLPRMTQPRNLVEGFVLVLTTLTCIGSQMLVKRFVVFIRHWIGWE